MINVKEFLINTSRTGSLTLYETAIWIKKQDRSYHLQMLIGSTNYTEYSQKRRKELD